MYLKKRAVDQFDMIEEETEYAHLERKEKERRKILNEEEVKMQKGKLLKVEDEDAKTTEDEGSDVLIKDRKDDKTSLKSSVVLRRKKNNEEEEL